MPSTSVDRGLHVALTMDGNGRWARRRGLPRIAGHHAGVRAVRRVVRAAPELGIAGLTLYAFSADNWRRPAAEVERLMKLLEEYLRREQRQCLDHGVRVQVIGRRDRLPGAVRRAIAATEQATAAGETLCLRLAIDYSAREQLLRAARSADAADLHDRDAFADHLARTNHPAAALGDVDLAIRTSGEQRLSDFLLWECAYAELYFTPRLWPDFDAADLAAALAHYHRRERRYGGLEPALLATKGERR